MALEPQLQADLFSPEMVGCVSFVGWLVGWLVGWNVWLCDGLLVGALVLLVSGWLSHLVLGWFVGLLVGCLDG
jgi:hypothetical protein